MIAFDHIGSTYEAWGRAYISTWIPTWKFTEEVKYACGQVSKLTQVLEKRRRYYKNYHQYEDQFHVFNQAKDRCHDVLRRFEALATITRRDEEDQKRHDLLAEAHREHHVAIPNAHSSVRHKTETTKHTKRGAGVAAALMVGSVIMGISAAVVASISQGETSAIVTHMRSDEAALNALGSSYNHMLNNTENLERELQFITAHANYVVHESFAERSVTSAERSYMNIQSVYTAAMDGRLDAAVITTEHTETAMRRLRDGLYSRDQRPLIDTTMELLQCETSFAANSSGILLLTEILTIPRTAAPMPMYQF